MPEAQRFAHVVGDEDGGFPQPVAQLQKLILQFQACYRVQRAERFVEKQELWFGRQRSRHAHALSLAAGKLARIAIEKLRGRQAHLIEQFSYPRGDALRAASHSVAAPGRHSRRR